MWLLVAHFACRTISSAPHYYTVSNFSHPSQFVLKTEHFPHVSVENHMQKYSQRAFFHLTFVDPDNKVINLTKLVQIIFSAWCGYFEYVSYLPHGITLIVLKVLIWLLLISTDLPLLGMSPSKKSQSWNFAKRFLHFLHIQNKSFFLHFSLHCLIKIVTLKMLLFSLLSSVLKCLHKNLPILIIF